MGSQNQFGVICNIKLGPRLEDLAFLQWATASISQHNLNTAFNGRNHNRFVDDLSAHILCSNVTDLDVYTIDVCTLRIRCKNVLNLFHPGGMQCIKSKGLFYNVKSITWWRLKRTQNRAVP
ncbi:hypothetical protein ONS79_20545 [Aeromonas hydrophila subsp. hydrophila]|uniref:hypothetical protein n=4 Tax=Aeromonas hydrophila TaxID=644 RepID=UPI0023EFBD1F|nr:hypothetical protein [Aeromonas hydrophila]MDF5705954.1 hypothetical protein [Aeromonas hydrophila subsp. hydrophila]